MAKTRGKMTPSQKSQAKWGLAFVAPTMIGLIVLNFYPIFNTVYQSFFKTGDIGIPLYAVRLSDSRNSCIDSQCRIFNP